MRLMLVGGYIGKKKLKGRSSELDLDGGEKRSKVFQRLQKTKAPTRGPSHQAGGTPSNSPFFQLSAKYWQLYSTASFPFPTTKTTTRPARTQYQTLAVQCSGEREEGLFCWAARGLLFLRYNMARVEGSGGEA